MFFKKKVYLDGAANTPIDKKVLKAMRPFLKPGFVGNSMAIHDYGIAASAAIEQARRDIADVLKVKVCQVYFTSGATESNNWVIKSIAEKILREGNKQKILCSAVEHASVLNCCKQVEEWGVHVEYIHSNKLLTGDKLSLCFKDFQPFCQNDDVALICAMAVNNEVGTCSDVADITREAYKYGIPTLVDCTQALSLGGTEVELGELYPWATFFSFSGHKIYGPTGVGCLVSRYLEPLSPLIIGGAQEYGMRGGTMNTAAIVGMAAALKDLHAHPELQWRYTGLNMLLREGLWKISKTIHANDTLCQPNILSLNFSEVLHYNQLASGFAMHGVAVSAGSACDAQHNEAEGEFNGSHVLKELGLSEEEIRNTVRVSFTKHTTPRDIKYFLKQVKELIADEERFKNSSNS